MREFKGPYYVVKDKETGEYFGGGDDCWVNNRKAAISVPVEHRPGFEEGRNWIAYMRRTFPERELVLVRVASLNRKFRDMLKNIDHDFERMEEDGWELLNRWQESRFKQLAQFTPPETLLFLLNKHFMSLAASKAMSWEGESERFRVSSNLESAAKIVDALSEMQLSVEG